MDQRSGVVISLLLLHLIACSQGLAVSTPQCPPDRGERFFFLAPRVPPQPVPTVTTTYTSTRVISEVWLSSCVTYATALPNCPRDARGGNLGRSPLENRLDPKEVGEGKMELNPTKVQPILSTDAPHLPKDELTENERQFRMFSKPFWEDLVGLAFPLRSGEADRPTPPLPSTSIRQKSTITRTVTVTATKRVKGPKTVVSFSIVGCLPSKLPFDLERCDEPERTLPSLRNSTDVSTEGPPSEVEESSTIPSTERTQETETVTSDAPPTSTELSNPSEIPTEETSPESEQMIPAPNESATTTGTPEEHEELGSGFAK